MKLGPVVHYLRTYYYLIFSLQIQEMLESSLQTSKNKNGYVFVLAPFAPNQAQLLPIYLDLEWTTTHFPNNQSKPLPIFINPE